MSMIAPKIPVTVVFRMGPNPLKGAVTGLLAGGLKEIFDKAPVYALLPYARITNSGANAMNLVRVFADDIDGRNEYATDWTQMIRDTTPATPDQYQDLLTSLSEHGYDVTIIKATQVDHVKRKTLYIDEVEAPDVEYVTEDVVIDFDIVNDDVDAPFLDPEEWA